MAKQNFITELNPKNFMGYWVYNPHREDNIVLKAEGFENHFISFSNNIYLNRAINSHGLWWLNDGVFRYRFTTGADFTERQCFYLNSQIFVIRTDETTTIFCREGLAEVVAYQWAMENNISNNASYNNDFMQNVLEMSQKESIIKKWGYY